MDTNTLLAYGAAVRKYKKGDILFYEGDPALYYYQIESGEVKMFNMNDEGKEFTQGIFSDGDSFGEPPMLIDEIYPATAIVNVNAVIYRLPKNQFVKMLEQDNSLAMELLMKLARRNYAKAVTAGAIINKSPEKRLSAFLRDYKKKFASAHAQKISVKLTRQEMANLTGLRVETVIRTLSEMHKKGLVEIKDRKLYI